jgi:hypothetical protein
MQEVLNQILSRLADKWQGLLIGAVFTIIGWYLGKRRGMAQWKKKEFLDRINVSLNTIADGTLKIRTLTEKSCHEVFLNSTAVDAVAAACLKTTPEDPILPFPREEYWHFLNPVLNEISEQFSEGMIRRDMGLPVRSERYVICLTFECAGQMRTRKLRAMVIQRKLLEELPGGAVSQREKTSPMLAPKFESPTHITRWTTLQQLAKSWVETPERFQEMEIVVPA